MKINQKLRFLCYAWFKNAVVWLQTQGVNVENKTREETLIKWLHFSNGHLTIRGNYCFCSECYSIILYICDKNDKKFSLYLKLDSPFLLSIIGLGIEELFITHDKVLIFD